MPRRRSTGGFTLIELLVVVTIIGILAAIAIPGLLTALDRAKQASSASLLRAFAIALEAYGTDNHGYPVAASVAALVPLLAPYSDSLHPRDEWKHDIGYTTDKTHYTLECYGKDGVDGLDISPATRYNFELDIVYSDGAFVHGID